MKFKSPVLIIQLLTLFWLSGAVLPALALEDHPLISRYEGSTLKDKKFEEFSEYKLVTGFTDKGEFSGEKLNGRLTRIVYENPAGRSTLEIFTNYKQALEKINLAIIFTCELEECGPSYARSAWNRYNGLFTASDGDPRYMGGKVTTADGTAYVAIMVGRLRTQLDIIEIVGMEEDRVVADAEALAKSLDRDGKVSVYGIYFDTDKADIKSESKPSLDEIARLLNERPLLKLFVVGHTDMTGSLAHNLSLSKARAVAVVKALIQDYGITTNRLEGHGVGPLAPAATNESSSGRAKNRRVELVAR